MFNEGRCSIDCQIDARGQLSVIVHCESKENNESGGTQDTGQIEALIKYFLIRVRLG